MGLSRTGPLMAGAWQWRQKAVIALCPRWLFSPLAFLCVEDHRGETDVTKTTLHLANMPFIQLLINDAGFIVGLSQVNYLSCVGFFCINSHSYDNI